MSDISNIKLDYKIDIGVVFILGFIVFIFLVYVLPYWLGGKTYRQNKDKKPLSTSTPTPTPTNAVTTATSFSSETSQTTNPLPFENKNVQNNMELIEKTINNNKVFIELKKKEKLELNKNNKNGQNDEKNNDKELEKDKYNSLYMSNDEYYKEVRPCNGNFTRYYDVSQYNL